MNDHLQQAYTETTYAVFFKDKTFHLKVNTTNLEFINWSNQKKIRSWAIITAFNPYSQELNNHENKELNVQLETLLTKSGFSFTTAKGIPNNTDWDAEESFLIHNISLEKAQDIGTFFKQNAIVFGSLNTPEKLIWLV